jgi:glycosyltransferase involved in cell wall biosynthesis
MTPGVSIIIPAYNAAHTLPRAIDSALAQTYPGVEVIVVNDGSSDQTDEVASDYGARIRAFRQENRGVSAARNFGAGVAEGEWLAFLDADDSLLPTMVEDLARAALEMPSAAAVSGAHFHVRAGLETRRPEEGAILGPGVTSGLVPGFFKTLCRDFTFFWTSALLVRKSVFHDLGGFQEHLSFGEDADLWCRIGAQHPWGFLDRPVFRYNSDSPGSLSKRASLRQKIGFFWDEEEMRRRVQPGEWSFYRRFRAQNIIRSAHQAARSGPCELALPALWTTRRFLFTPLWLRFAVLAGARSLGLRKPRPPAGEGE